MKLKLDAPPVYRLDEIPAPAMPIDEFQWESVPLDADSSGGFFLQKILTGQFD